MATVQEDYLINLEGDNIILGLAADNHMKKDVQRDCCRDEEEVNPPTTGVALYVEEIYLGEVVPRPVQECSSLFRIIVTEE